MQITTPPLCSSFLSLSEAKQSFPPPSPGGGKWTAVSGTPLGGDSAVSWASFAKHLPGQPRSRQRQSSYKLRTVAICVGEGDGRWRRVCARVSRREM